MVQEEMFGWGEDLITDTKAEAKKEAVAKVKAKKKSAQPMTEAELKVKWREILSNPKNSEADKRKLDETYHAWNRGIVFPQTPKLSKAEALRMYVRLFEIQRDDKLRKMVEETPEKYVLIQTEEDLAQVVEWWENEEIVALDTETDGLDVVHGETEMIGISITFPTVDKDVYIPVRHDEGTQLSPAVVIQALKPYIESKTKKKVLHNAKFDAHVLSMEGAKLKGIEMDTMVALWCLNENEPNYRLKDVANRYAQYLNIEAENDTFDQLFGKATFNTVALKYALVYAAKDTEITWKLYKFIKAQMERPELAGVKRIYETMENPLVDVVIQMEECGFLLNVDKVDVIDEELSKDISLLEKQLLSIFGDINFGSPAQLSAKLYDDMKLPDVSGKRSTDKKTLKKLAETNIEIQLLLDYRGLTKMMSSFIEKLPVLVKPTGRVYGQFDQKGTKTGRFSSKEPNLQQLPQKARTIFRAPTGRVIIGADYSQIEPRFLSHITGDEELRKPYMEGYDLYSTMASKTLNLEMKYCVDGASDPKGRKPRKMMKTGLLAVMYGTSMFTLANQLEITVEEAQTFINDFFEAYPIVGAWIDGIQQSVKKNEYVETSYGRKRRFTKHRQEAEVYDKIAKEICRFTGEAKVPANMWDEKYKTKIPYKTKRAFQNVKGNVERVRRQAVNAIIQGSSADIMKLAMIRLNALCEKYSGEDWKMLATIHDEVLIELPETVTKEQIQEVEEAMTHAVTLDVPMKVDIAFMREWGIEVSREEWFENK